MTSEILTLLLFTITFAIACGTWKDNGAVARVVWLGVVAALAGLIVLSRIAAVERIQVIAVNTDRSESLSFAVGDSIEMDSEGKRGLLSPFQVAARRYADGRLEVFSNNNSLLWWKFNKQAIQLELTPGTVCDVRVTGWYGLRNLIEVTQIHPRSAGDKSETRPRT